MLRARAVRLLGQRIVAEIMTASQLAGVSEMASFTCTAAPPRKLLPTCAAHLCGRRWASATPESVAEQVDTINRLFAEARDEIESAREDAETVYFNESVQEAKRLTDSTLKAWERLLAALSGEEKRALQRSMGLKIEQLKAELSGLDELHA